MSLTMTSLKSSQMQRNSSSDGIAMFGHLDHHPDFPSRYVMPRNVDIWLPPNYHEGGTDQFPVLYMHDGQNLFDPKTSFIGVDWGVHEAMFRLIGEDKVRGTIVVGIWNTANRFQEYLPNKLFEISSETATKVKIDNKSYTQPLSDHYLRFVIDELKPFVDQNYQTMAGRSDTFMMGSSMGGLVSLYALCEYPGVFGGIGCLSTHWPAVDGVLIGYLERTLPKPGDHKVYFDYGTRTLDVSYERYQRQVDNVVKTIGYIKGKDWITQKFEGAEHSERSWRDRVHIPLTFLLGKEPA